MTKTTADTEFHILSEFLKAEGYDLIDTNEIGQDIFRKDDIDILVEVIEHKDEL